MGGAYYNEFDPFAAQWLREMIGLGVLPPGEVDDRSIRDVTPDDLEGFTQCHFFAGIGGWAYAARLAGWPDDRPLWTGSCPCQPFSVAGEGRGYDDPRDLWPDFRRLIRARGPAVVVGEQVAGKAGAAWFDRVRAHLAVDGYAGRAVDVPACAVDAPNIRQRLWWAALPMADAGRLIGGGGPAHPEDGTVGANGHGARFALAHAGGERPVGRAGLAAGDDGDRHHAGRREEAGRASERDAGGRMVDASRDGRREGRAERELRGGRRAASHADAPGDLGDGAGSGSQGLALTQRLGGPAVGWSDAQRADGRDGGSRDVGHAAGGSRSGAREREALGRAQGRGEYRGPDAGGGDLADADLAILRGQSSAWELAFHEPDARAGAWPGSGDGSFWRDAVWIACHDGKARRAEPGVPLLAHGIPARVPKWRGFGNAINPQLGAEVLAALLDVLPPHGEDAGRAAA